MEEGYVCEKEGRHKIIECEALAVDSTSSPDKPRKVTQWSTASPHQPDPVSSLWTLTLSRPVSGEILDWSPH